MKSVVIRVPATTANLGPGFDTLGCALTLYNRLSFAKTQNGLSFSHCEPRFRNPDNLAYRAFQDVFSAVGQPMPQGIHIDFAETAIPVSRGLGSSAALLAAGAVAANAFLGNLLTKADLLRITTKIEGHPDNLAPAIYGGLTASLVENGVPYAVGAEIAPRFHFCAFIPDYETDTRSMRKVLPDAVPLSDGTYNVSHTAVLLQALRLGDAELSKVALSDRFHEPYRRPLLPGFDEVHAIAMEEGALSLFISGSGSTLMALCEDDDFAHRAEKRIASLPQKFRIMPLGIDRVGTVTEVVSDDDC